MRVIPQQTFDAYPAGVKTTYRTGVTYTVSKTFGAMLVKKGLVVEEQTDPHAFVATPCGYPGNPDD